MTLKKFTNIVEKVQLTLGVTSLSIFFIAIMIQIGARYFGIPMIWTEEVANYSFIWAVFMGAAVMVNRKEHFRFDGLSKKLKGKAKIYLDIFNNLILLAFNIAILYYGIQALENFWDYRWMALPFLKMGYVWIAIPIMGITMVLYSLVHLIENIKQLGAKEVSE